MFDTHVDLTPLVMMLMDALVIPLIMFAVHLSTAKLGEKLEPYLGHERELALQKRVNELLDKGVGSAAMKYLPELQAHGLTVDTGSWLAAHAVDYFVAHAPELVPQVKTFEGSLEEKAKARILAHPAVHAALALPATVPMQAAA